MKPGTFVGSIVNFERLISSSDVGTFKFEEKSLIPQLTLSGYEHHRIFKKNGIIP